MHPVVEAKRTWGRQAEGVDAGRSPSRPFSFASSNSAKRRTPAVVTSHWAMASETSGWLRISMGTRCRRGTVRRNRGGVFAVEGARRFEDYVRVIAVAGSFGVSRASENGGSLRRSRAQRGLPPVVGAAKRRRRRGPAFRWGHRRGTTESSGLGIEVVVERGLPPR